MKKINLSTPKKKETVPLAEKENHLATHTATYSCVCGAKFETISTSPQNFSVSSCIQCNSFYTGVSAQEVKVGAIAKFRQKFGSPKNN
ncbi:MAG: 50S ribosomal protein L31 [Mycoplasmataceae bacterium RC_NB112A]|nr:MAG: 50S ribosomal protein L31 [Mycoplasmataceae bacterium RC_NB112A]